MKQLIRLLLPARLRAFVDLLRSVEFWERRTIMLLGIQRLFGMHRSDRLPSALRPNPLVIFLCRGNIYRSSMAEALFVRELRSYSPGLARACSAGLRATLDREAPDDARTVAAEWGLSLENHRAKPLTVALVRDADLFVVMDRQNEVVLLSRFPEAIGRTVLLGTFDEDSAGLGSEIADPYGHGLLGVRACYGRLSSAIGTLAREIDRMSDNASPAPDQSLRRPVRELLTAPTILPAFAPFARHCATIFMMHRFADAATAVAGHDPMILSRHLAYLRRNKFNLCSLESLVRRLRDGEPPLPRTVVFTVDDAYSDFGKIGAPVFESFDCPATVFVVTGFLDRKLWLWWDQVAYLIGERAQDEIKFSIGEHVGSLRWSSPAERARRTELLIERLKRVPSQLVQSTIRSLEASTGRTLPEAAPSNYAPMTWDEVRAWTGRGIDFAPHTHTHPILSRTTADRSAEEIQTSFRRLSESTGKSLPIFAYPNGMSADFGDRERAAAQQAGLIAAVSAFGGHCTAGHFAQDPYGLPRIPYVESKASFLQVVGGVEWLKAHVRSVLPWARAS